MIHYITGKVISIKDDVMILENAGIGFYLTMPLSSSSMYEIGSADAKVFTYMAVKEDDISLYGFASEKELELFELLLSVNSIGPKAAVNILSCLSASELCQAILAEDSKLIAQAKNVGQKGAQKVILELKSKIEKMQDLEVSFSPNKSVSGISNDIIFEAIEILEALGFSRSKAKGAIESIEMKPGATSSEIVSLALKVID